MILAGGAGERLWPASDLNRPKQFMSLHDGKSFLQGALERAAALQPSGSVLVVTRSGWVDLVQADIAALLSRPEWINRISPEKFIILAEPVGRNTAAAIAWACRYLEAADRPGSARILMMASDHIISPVESFCSDCLLADNLVSSGSVVTFGIPPTGPATGYGYIKLGSALHTDAAGEAFLVEGFREKPDAATARLWLNEGGYVWNSGLYGFRLDVMLEELERSAPDILASFPRSTEQPKYERLSGANLLTDWPGLAESYSECPSVSIDYAVSEHCLRLASVRASFRWDDVGSWDSLSAWLPPDSGTGAVVRFETQNCTVRSELPVALCGVEDLIVVIENGRALVAKRGKTALAKDALVEFKKAGL